MTQLTGWSLLDPLIAIAFSLLLFFQGERLIWSSTRELMDAAAEQLLRTIAHRLVEKRETSWINIHFLRAWRSGRALYGDMHRIVPHYFEVSQLHDIQEKVKETVLKGEEEGDLIIHFDPCLPYYCSSCAMKDCPIRDAKCIKQDPLSYSPMVQRRSPLFLAQSAAKKSTAEDNPN